MGADVVSGMSPEGESGRCDTIIFASSIILFPAQISNMLGGSEYAIMQKLQYWLSPGHGVYMLLYGMLIIFFCYFYTAIQFNPVDIADNLKKYGGFIPGIRPGQNRLINIMRILNRITLFRRNFSRAYRKSCLTLLYGSGRRKFLTRWPIFSAVHRFLLSSVSPWTP